MSFFNLCIFVICIALSGCVAPQQFIAPTATPNPNVGYLSGMFSGRGNGFGFGIIDVGSKKEYLMPFFDAHIIASTQEEQIRLIEVPPGLYRVAYWATYNGFNERTTKQNLPDRGEQSVFMVKPGRVTFIGRYKVSQESSFNRIYFKVMPQKVSKDEFLSEFKISYPNFPADSVD
jgi:hypothetical protein